MVFAGTLNHAKAVSCIRIAYLSGTVQGPRKMTSSTAMASICIGNCSEGCSEFNPDSKWQRCAQADSKTLVFFLRDDST